MQRLVTPDPAREVRGLDAALAAPTTSIPRPTKAEIHTATTQAARDVAARDQNHQLGLIELLREIAEPLVARLVELDWPTQDAQVAVVGAELSGTVDIQLPDGRHSLHFIADRCDRHEGGLRFKKNRSFKKFKFFLVA